MADKIRVLMQLKGGGGGDAKFQNKDITITTNGSTTLTPDSGYDGIKKSIITVNVPKPNETDATATANDILLNKTAYVNNNKITGTIGSVSGSTVIPTTNDVTLSLANKYVLSNVIIKGDSDLKAENIKKNVDIFGVIGSYEGEILNVNTMGIKFGNSTFENFPTIFDFDGVTDYSFMFYSCPNLKTIPQINTTNITNFERIFYNCSSLENIPQINTSSATNIKYMFGSCSDLISLPKLNFSNVTENMTYTSNFLTGFPSPNISTNNYPNLTDLEGFTGIKVNFWLNGCQSITEQSIINVFTEMADLTGQTPQTVHLGYVNTLKCSAQTLQIATDKNWLVD